MTNAKTVRISKKGQFVIPKEMWEVMGVKEGDEILISFDEGRVILTRPQEYARKTRGLLKGTWGKNPKEVTGYLEKERRAWRTQLFPEP
jgi:AbrB family looped-hinge helix DNA binding protein